MTRHLALALVCLVPAVASAVPVELPYQGRLTDAEGEPINGQTDLTVRLYSSATNVVFTETFDDVTVDDGYFAIRLGADPDNFPLEHTVAGQAVAVEVDIGSPVTFTTRSDLGTTPSAAFAYDAAHAATADAVGGLTPASLAAIGTLQVSYTNCAWTACVDGGSSVSACPAGKVMRAMDVSTADSQKPVGCTGTNHEDEYRSYCCSAEVTLVPAQ